MVLCYNFGIDPGLVGFLCCLLVNFHSFPPHWESFPTLSPLVCLPYYLFRESKDKCKQTDARVQKKGLLLYTCHTKYGG